MSFAASFRGPIRTVDKMKRKRARRLDRGGREGGEGRNGRAKGRGEGRAEGRGEGRGGGRGELKSAKKMEGCKLWKGHVRRSQRIFIFRNAVLRIEKHSKAFFANGHALSTGICVFGTNVRKFDTNR